MLTKVDNIIHAKYFKLNKLLFEWTDKYLREDYLVRSIGNSTYHFINGELSLVRTERKSSPISKTNIDKNLIIEY